MFSSYSTDPRRYVSPRTSYDPFPSVARSDRAPLYGERRDEPLYVAREPASPASLRYEYTTAAAPSWYRQDFGAVDDRLRRPLDEYYIAPDVATAAKLDAADGVMDGRFCGVDILTDADSPPPRSTRSLGYVVPDEEALMALDAADGVMDGRHRGAPIQTEEDVVCENTRLRTLLKDLSDRFKHQFEQLAGQRDKELLDLQSKYNHAVKQLKGPKGKAGAKSVHATKPGKPTAKKPSARDTETEGPPAVRFYVKEAVGLVTPRDVWPSVAITLHNRTKETTPHEPSAAPVWHEVLEFPEPPGAGRRRVTVVLKHAKGELGRAEVELPTYAVESDVWVPVSHADKVVGNIHLGIEANRALTTLPGKMPPSASAPLVGAEAHRDSLPNGGRRDSLQSGGRRASAKDGDGRRDSAISAASSQPNSEALEGARPLPSLSRPHLWDLAKMDGEKFWVCLVAKEGQLVLDPVEFKKAPALWALSQPSAEAVFHAYNTPFQTAMRRKGLNKLNSYWQQEINDMKGIYLSHLDDHVGGPKAVSLRAKEEQILVLERKLAEVEASRDDMAAKLVESATLLTDKTHEIQDMNRVLNAEMMQMAENRRLAAERKHIEEGDFQQMMSDNRNWAARTEARLYQLQHVDPRQLSPEQLVEEVNMLREELLGQRHANDALKGRLRAVGDNTQVRDRVERFGAPPAPPSPGYSPSRATPQRAYAYV